MKRLFCYLPLLLVWMAAMACASELEPVIFVLPHVAMTADVAEAEAQASQAQVQAAQRMAKAAVDKDAEAQRQAAEELSQAMQQTAALKEALAGATRLADDFTAVLANAVKVEFACAQVVKESEIQMFYDQQRDLGVARAQAGSDPLEAGEGENNPQAEFMVTVRVTPKADKGGMVQTSIFAGCKYIKSGKVLASVSSDDGAGADLAGLLVEQMMPYEICPYLGTVTVEVASRKDNPSEAEHDVYCNQSGGHFSRSEIDFSQSDQRWELRKTGRRAATGDLNYTDSEKREINEANDCHKCPSGSQGRRTLTKRTSVEVRVKGISDKSAGKPGETVNKDARITIRFLDDGYFMLVINACSQGGTETIREYEHATGVCDGIDRDPPPRNAVRDIPLDQELGPFRGEPRDKTLSLKQWAIPIGNKENKEESTLTLDLDLSRQ